MYCMVSDPALVQVEAGNRALKAVFSSKLTAKGRSLAELLQPHSTGRIHRPLPPMVWLLPLPPPQTQAPPTVNRILPLCTDRSHFI